MQETVDVEQAFLSDPCRLMPQYTPESRCLGAGYASARAQAVSQDAGLGRSAAVQMPMKGHGSTRFRFCAMTTIAPGRQSGRVPDSAVTSAPGPGSGLFGRVQGCDMLRQNVW